MTPPTEPRRKADAIYAAAKRIFAERYGREPRMVLAMDRQRVALIEADLWKDMS